jgi:hypothetical protein
MSSLRICLGRELHADRKDDSKANISIIRSASMFSAHPFVHFHKLCCEQVHSLQMGIGFPCHLQVQIKLRLEGEGGI